MNGGSTAEISSTELAGDYSSGETTAIKSNKHHSNVDGVASHALSNHTKIASVQGTSGKFPSSPTRTMDRASSTVDNDYAASKNDTPKRGTTNNPLTKKKENNHATSQLSISDAAMEPPAIKSVTEKRKNELLAMARKDRLQWMEQVPMPFRSVIEKDNPWMTDSRLAMVQSSHAGREIPAALPVLTHLYGMKDAASTDAIARRIETLLAIDVKIDNDNNYCDQKHNLNTDQVVPSGSQLLAMNLKCRRGHPEDVLLLAYDGFFKLLQDPASATLVQGMRSFCRHIQDFKHTEEVSTKIRSFVASTFDTMQSNTLWKGSKGSSQFVEEELYRRCLESFLYGQCQSHIESILWTDTAKSADQSFVERLESLQFVTPGHLEIGCLEHQRDDEDSKNSTDYQLHELLKAPIAALVSVDAYYSPFEKLQRILAVYHGVNAALTASLNPDSTSGKHKKLPSADDVLPTIILTVLKSKPERLNYNLQFVEDFIAPEYLRGEAGYAYTNLYGAVQFLQDLDLNEPSSLSIGSEEFRQSLVACRETAKERIRQQHAPVQQVPWYLDSQSIQEKSRAAMDLSRLRSIHIPPNLVRGARMRGEELDDAWAQRLLEPQANGGGLLSRSEHSTSTLERLPTGFSRKYNFLTSRPEDIKLTDLPQLLREYRMLVHATEQLLGERAAKAAAERKARMHAMEQDIRNREKEFRFLQMEQELAATEAATLMTSTAITSEAETEIDASRPS